MADNNGGKKAEFITPPNNLKLKVQVAPGEKGIDLATLERAESVISDMQNSYLEWVENDLKSLEDAIAEASKSDGDLKAHFEKIFSISHDIKGQGGSFGYQMMTNIGNQLCRFIETLDTPSKADIHIVRLHFDAMKLVIAKRMEGDGGKTGEELVAGLQAVVAKLKSR
jgi:chemotaxis protein histidine kinase CheA